MNNKECSYLYPIFKRDGNRLNINKYVAAFWIYSNWNVEIGAHNLSEGHPFWVKILSAEYYEKDVRNLKNKFIRHTTLKNYYE